LATSTHEIIATLHQVASGLLDADQAGLSEIAWQRLAVEEDDLIYASHPKPIDSLSFVRRRIYGNRLDEAPFRAIIADVVKGSYSDVHLSSFLTACAALPLDKDQTIALTKAMVDVGEKLTWDSEPVVDKHSVGGLPGNRTTPIVVSIVAAHGLTMPKTSSRAITSPAGTADTMETMAPVDLDLAAKLAGAPESKAAGVHLAVQVGARVSAGAPLCTVHAETPGELHYALDYAAANPDIIEVAAA
jgi:thymidine phosphorylase